MPFTCHILKKKSFQVKITIKPGGLGNIYICTLLDTAFRDYFMTVTGVVDHFLIK